MLGMPPQSNVWNNMKTLVPEPQILRVVTGWLRKATSFAQKPSTHYATSLNLNPVALKRQIKQKFVTRRHFGKSVQYSLSFKK
jgi:hypothetical protein